MQSLLRWSIENSTHLDSTPNGQPPAPSKDLDPGIIDMILGKPDSVLMKEDLAVAVDPNRTEDDRINALDHLEMLIEQIDNANNLEVLKMWEPLQSLLTSDTSTPPIKTQVLWVIGTALQNNPAAQEAYLDLNPLPVLISFLDPTPSSTLQIRSKVVYTLSGLLRHNAPAVEALASPDVDGWIKLRDSLRDPEIAVRRKTIFLLGTLLIPSTPPASSISPPDPSNFHTEPIHANSHASHLANPARTVTSKLALNALRKNGLLETVVAGLTNPLSYGEDGDSEAPDADFEEKGVRLLHTYAVMCGGELSPSEKSSLKSWLEKEKAKDGESALAERWSLSAEELKALLATVA